jgi:hypothetical protein
MVPEIGSWYGFQDAILGCPGCWNPSSHAFNRTRNKRPPIRSSGELSLATSYTLGKETFRG